MQIIKPYETIYSIGVLWNVSKEFYKEMMKKIAIENPVIQIRKYNMGDKYIEFLRKCYQDDVSEGYLTQKVDRIEIAPNRDMIVFVTKIDNPEYDYDENKDKYPCKQISELKKKIRGEYSKKVENYFYDVLLHMSDDMKETEKMKNILCEYDDKIEEEFVRNGYEPYMKLKDRNPKKNKTYCSTLKSMECER